MSNFDRIAQASFVILLIISFVVGCMMISRPAHSSEPGWKYRINYYWAIDHYRSINQFSDERIQGLNHHIRKYANKYELDPLLVVVFIGIESTFINRIGQTGEAGYMQITPQTFYETCGYRTTEKRLVYDYSENIRCGTKHIRDLMNKHRNYTVALGKYNCYSCEKGNRWYVRYILNEIHDLMFDVAPKFLRERYIQEVDRDRHGPFGWLLR